MSNLKIYRSNIDFHTESGSVLNGLEIAYNFYGDFRDTERKTIWICHALTANSDPVEWWPGIAGDFFVLDTKRFNIICANILGSCYGSSGPLHHNPDTGKPYYRHFPQLTVRDLVKAHILLADHLAISRIDLLIGGSVGSHQAIEWSVMQPERIKNLAIIAGSAVSSPWLKAFSASQRMAIETDPTYYEDRPDGGVAGMGVARSIALLSYRNGMAYNITQYAENESPFIVSRAESYQRYQAKKLMKRFNAYSYYILTQTLDSMDAGRDRGGLKKALARISAKTLVLGIKSDLLFSVEEQKLMDDLIPNSTLNLIDSDFGHDGFLIEKDALSNALLSVFTFLNSKENGK